MGDTPLALTACKFVEIASAGGNVLQLISSNFLVHRPKIALHGGLVTVNPDQIVGDLVLGALHRIQSRHDAGNEIIGIDRWFSGHRVAVKGVGPEGRSQKSRVAAVDPPAIAVQAIAYRFPVRQLGNEALSVWDAEKWIAVRTHARHAGATAGARQVSSIG